jgi:hypothetical protein
MKLTALYVWSASVTVKVPDTATNEEQREALDNAAAAVELDFRNPVLQECSNKELID